MRAGVTRGEGRAGARPLNSALEVDLDFERAVRPPPAPTEAATASLEDLIRRRVSERQWDDPPKVAPPAPEARRRELKLDDQKSAKARPPANLSMKSGCCLPHATWNCSNSHNCAYYPSRCPRPCRAAASSATRGAPRHALRASRELCHFYAIAVSLT